MCLNSLCRWQVQVYVYRAMRIPVQLRCTQCSILLHLIDICFLPCICLWQMSQIQTCLCVVVESGFVSTSLTFMRSSASHSADPHGRLAKKKVNRAPPPPFMAAGGVDTICTTVCNRRDCSTVCRLSFGACSWGRHRQPRKCIQTSDSIHDGMLW